MPEPSGGFRLIFLSTPSARRATTTPAVEKLDTKISIHALREEGDILHPRSGCPASHFYPRPPRGGRRTSTWVKHRTTTFLSTPSARRATRTPAPTIRVAMISIHALREEGDNLTSEEANRIYDISIHALREEGDYCGLSQSGHTKNFYPRPPRGGRRLASRSACSAF